MAVVTTRVTSRSAQHRAEHWQSLDQGRPGRLAMLPVPEGNAAIGQLNSAC